MGREPQLRPRLEILHQKVRTFLPEAAGFHDIACDHGNLSAAVARSRPDLRIEASDILPGAIARAESEHPDLKVRFFASDGFMGHTLRAGDGVVIAGVGGHTMIEILEGARGWQGDPKPEIELWLQTKQQVEILRDYLYTPSPSFYLRDECLVEDRGQIYQLFELRLTLPLRPRPCAIEPYYRCYGAGPRLLAHWQSPGDAREARLLEAHFRERLNFARMKARVVTDPRQQAVWREHARRMERILRRQVESNDQGPGTEASEACDRPGAGV